MAVINPNKYASVQEMLAALSFAVDGEFFVNQDIRFSVGEICGYTPMTFYEKAKRRGWIQAEASASLSAWGSKFLSVFA